MGAEVTVTVGLLGWAVFGVEGRAVVGLDEGVEYAVGFWHKPEPAVG